MKIGVIDADLISRRKHRFPNLACEKISAYWKEQGAEVALLLNYDLPEEYDEIYISKVFTDTPVPDFISNLATNNLVPNNNYIHKIKVGGTGFYFDKAPNLPDEIEHHMPDYHLYDEWIHSEVERARLDASLSGKQFNEARFMLQFKEYTDYSIGFLTRGCFRKCPFCVNQKFNHVFDHSPLQEFYDPTRKKLCFLDDNFLGSPHWNSLLSTVLSSQKAYKFKQGLDERLLTNEKCETLFNSNYDGDLTFAFDNIEDYDLIHTQLKKIRKFNPKKGVMFYVLVGFKSTDAEDIRDAFLRIELLFHYRCLPYIMRYMSKDNAPWKNSKFRSLYISIARWCNQPNIVKKMTFREFCHANQELKKKSATICVSMKALNDFEKEYPEIANAFFDLRFGEPNSKFLNED